MKSSSDSRRSSNVAELVRIPRSLGVDLNSHEFSYNNSPSTQRSLVAINAE